MEYQGFSPNREQTGSAFKPIGKPRVRRFSPTLPGCMNSTRSRIGWCSTTTVQQGSASAPLNSARSKVNASCADASRDAENTINL